MPSSETFRSFMKEILVRGNINIILENFNILNYFIYFFVQVLGARVDLLVYVIEMQPLPGAGAGPQFITT